MPNRTAQRVEHKVLAATCVHDNAIGWLRLENCSVTRSPPPVAETPLWIVGGLSWAAKRVGLYHPALDSPIGLGA